VFLLGQNPLRMHGRKFAIGLLVNQFGFPKPQTATPLYLKHFSLSLASMAT
jgi:hypothetical protein